MHGQKWKVDLHKFLKDAVNTQGPPESIQLADPAMSIAAIMLELAERCVQLNDPKLNALMCRLILYQIADPNHPDYDPELCETIYKKAYSNYGATESLNANPRHITPS